MSTTIKETQFILISALAISISIVLMSHLNELSLNFLYSAATVALFRWGWLQRYEIWNYLFPVNAKVDYSVIFEEEVTEELQLTSSVEELVEFPAVTDPWKVTEVVDEALGQEQITALIADIPSTKWRNLCKALKAKGYSKYLKNADTFSNYLLNQNFSLSRLESAKLSV